MKLLGDLVMHILSFIVAFFKVIGDFIWETLQQPLAWFFLALFVGGPAVIFSDRLAAAGYDYWTITLMAIGLAVIAGLGYLAFKKGSLAAGVLAFLLALFLFPELARVLLSIWWFWMFCALFPLFYDLWLHLKQEQFKQAIKWTLLELRIPRLVEETPQAMEQVLMAMHQLKNEPGDFVEKYVDGEVTRPFSFEIVSFGGEVHFYVRTYAKQRPLVEAAFFSYYPDVEIVEVEDYIDRFPKTVTETYQNRQDLYGIELKLEKHQAYPIRTYPAFETADPDKQLDPISALLEFLAKIKKEEIVGIQIVAAPSSAGWLKDKETTDLLEKLKNPNADKEKVDEKGNIIKFPKILTPGESDVLKAVEKNLSKPFYDTVIRLVYFSPAEMFWDTYPKRALLGSFNQYSAANLNSFKANNDVQTKTRVWDYPHVFGGVRVEYRKQRLLHWYRTRAVPPETYWGKWYMSYRYASAFVSKRYPLNVEAIATIFHPPTEFVLTAPHIKRVEARKAGAPAGLPIYGEEDVLERFYPDKK